MSHGSAHIYIWLGRLISRKEIYQEFDKRFPIKGYRTDLETGTLVPTKINKLRLKVMQFFQKSK